MIRKCPRCQERPVATSNGYCRECNRAFASEYRKANGLKVLEYQRKWREAHPGRATELFKLWRQNNPEVYKRGRADWRKKNPHKNKEYQRKSRLKRYGLTTDQYQLMLEHQKHKCAVCKTPIQTTKAAKVDHCHNTGIIRGMLCHACNVALGLMKENPTNIRRLAAYISKFK